MNSKTTLMVVSLAVAAFFIGKLWTEVRYLKTATPSVVPTVVRVSVTPSPQALIPAKQQKVDIKIDENDPVMGKSDAEITIIEFADYQCPFCGAFSGDNEQMIVNLKSRDASWEPLFPQLKKEYIDKGIVRFIYKDYAFLDGNSEIKESQLAGQAAHCAGDQDKYWEFSQYLYSHQDGENRGGFAIDKLKSFAKELSLDITNFNNCLDSGKYAQLVENNTKIGQEAGIEGTPAILINGQLLTDSQGRSGAFPYSFIKQAIEEELKK